MLTSFDGTAHVVSIPPLFNKRIIDLDSKEITLKGNGVTINEAIDILGSNFCVSVEQSTKAWGIPTRPDEIVSYSIGTLERASMDNIVRHERWILMWINGFTLTEQFKICGPSKNDQPCFYEWSPFFIDEKYAWAFQRMTPGYYLINFQPVISDLNHEETMAAIKNLNSSLIWCEEYLFSEAVLSYYKVKKIRLAEFWYHRGRNVFTNRMIMSVIVGHFNVNGLDVNGHSAAHSAKDVRTVVYQKHE